MTKTRTEEPPATPKFPHIALELSCEKGGGSFAIMSKVLDALRHHGIAKEQRDAFFAEANAAACEHVLATARKWVSVQ